MPKRRHKWNAPRLDGRFRSPKTRRAAPPAGVEAPGGCLRCPIGSTRNLVHRETWHTARFGWGLRCDGCGENGILHSFDEVGSSHWRRNRTVAPEFRTCGHRNGARSSARPFPEARTTSAIGSAAEPVITRTVEWLAAHNTEPNAWHPQPSIPRGFRLACQSIMASGTWPKRSAASWRRPFRISRSSSVITRRRTIPPRYAGPLPSATRVSAITEMRKTSARIPNFNRAFELSRSPLFKWAAHDDLYHPRYLETCVRILDEIRTSSWPIPRRRSWTIAASLSLAIQRRDATSIRERALLKRRTAQ